MTENTAENKVSPGQLDKLAPSPAWPQGRSAMYEHQSPHFGEGDAVYCRSCDICGQSDRLDKISPNICYGKTGERNFAATSLINKRGFKTYALRGGLQALRDDK